MDLYVLRLMSVVRWIVRVEGRCPPSHMQAAVGAGFALTLALSEGSAHVYSAGVQPCRAESQYAVMTAILPTACRHDIVDLLQLAADVPWQLARCTA